VPAEELKPEQMFLLYSMLGGRVCGSLYRCNQTAVTNLPAMLTVAILDQLSVFPVPLFYDMSADDDAVRRAWRSTLVNYGARDIRALRCPVDRLQLRHPGCVKSGGGFKPAAQPGAGAAW